ncbi:MAG: NAD(P)/FAD-dependent oxidoreductase [Eubacteriales bacterium]|nr:NAD(P)/FAD-dependent oxidoreductase [Eubacteriales bacterium]MDD3881428.1 NAD(P)/FAD-dependent oxidoreductase [Eubacteriales bacterium]
MIRLANIAMPLSYTESELREKCARLLRVQIGEIECVRVAKKSVDARDRRDVHFVLSADVSLSVNEKLALSRSKQKSALLLPPPQGDIWQAEKQASTRPIVIGAGPAGLFAALYFAKAGVRPIVIERGAKMEERVENVSAFQAGGEFSEETNIQFGEGGAGTFSDGKLTTGIKDERCRVVLETFFRFGAPEEILYESKPHIGTDKLRKIIVNMRAEIERLGGEFMFKTRLSGLITEKNQLTGIRVTVSGSERELPCRRLILAIGHSARDTYRMLDDAGLMMEQKAFSLGARIEHPQKVINQAQYGAFCDHPALGAADYKLSAHLPNGRGVYTFCMCPGGVVVAAASQSGGVVTNGMSNFDRKGENANSALLVSIEPSDFEDEHPLAGLALQRLWERRAFIAGGESYRAPCQRLEDFMKGLPSRKLGSVCPSYLPGVEPANLSDCLPEYVVESMREGIKIFARQLRGFDMADALLTGVETRSSSPVRIKRTQSGQEASVAGVYPCGEGAGYAGGIMSAAVDGLRCAQSALDALE